MTELQQIEVDYTNWRGERSTRTVILTGRLLPGDAIYHPTARWVVEAWDVEKAAMRTFDLAHVHAWGDQKPQGSAAVFRASLATAKTAVFDAGIDPAVLDAGDGGAAARDLWRHVKRGTVYERIGEAELQWSGPEQVEGEPLTVYRAVDGGKLWARPSGEFEDGRFVPTTSTATGTEGHDHG